MRPDQNLPDSQVVSKFSEEIQKERPGLNDRMVAPTDPADQPGMVHINWIQCPGETALPRLSRPNQGVQL